MSKGKNRKGRHGNAPLRASTSEAAHTRRQRDQRRRIVRILVILSVLAMLVLVRIVAPVSDEGFLSCTPSLPAEERIEVGLGRIEVLDGDTIRLDGRNIRFLGCDAPESANPYFHGDQEPWAGRATAFVERKLREAETIEVEVLAERDRFNRLLGHIFVDGESLSLMLVQNGLAIETVSHYGDNGFPELAERILDAADEVGELPFEPPHEWRRANRKR